MTDFRHPSIRLLLAAAAVAVAAPAALAFVTGPFDGHTNAPGESNCTACHASFPLNSGTGQLALSGLPEIYEPDAVYDLLLTLSDPVALRWGFQLTILDDGGVSAGQIAVTDAGTQTSTTGSRTYLKHNLGGTAPGQTDAQSWSFRWTAPAAGAGDVTLYAAGNAADNDGTSAGDRIYATSFETSEDTGTSVGDLPAALVLLGAAPNPFNPATEIRFVLPRAGRATVRVYDAAGRLVATPADRWFEAGRQAAAWDGRDRGGLAAAAGIYVYTVEAAGERRAGRATLVK